MVELALRLELGDIDARGRDFGFGGGKIGTYVAGKIEGAGADAGTDDELKCCGPR